MVIKRRQRGQSIVEMAMIFPILVFFTIGTMELSFYIYTYSELENATRRASEAAAKTPPVTPSPCDDYPNGAAGSCSPTPDVCAVLIKQAAIDGVWASKLKPSDITIMYPISPERQIGNQIQVETTYTGQWLTPIGQRFLSDQLSFKFTSRRTISSLRAPDGRNADCTIPTH